ncbi:MAG: ATP-binding protein [Parabacteroides distasonis]|nr:ATP-binding protein [Parabacteroides distasonis]
MKEYLSTVLEILEEKGVLNESYDLEFKSAKGGLPRSLWESYSAFANSEGGTIILGVSEKDNYCYLDGLGEDVVRKSIMLKDLCSQGYLNPENKGRWTSYHLNKGIGLKQGSLFENLDGHLNEKMDTSDKKDGHLGRNMQEIKSSELKSYIVEICSSKYLTIEEIAVKTRRTSKYLKNKIVSQLLKDGLLERLYPTTPNHPNQAYKKKQQ